MDSISHTPILFVAFILMFWRLLFLVWGITFFIVNIVASI